MVAGPTFTLVTVVAPRIVTLTLALTDWGPMAVITSSPLVAGAV